MYENIQKNRYKIKERYITCSHIWHIDISKYVYLLSTHFVNVLEKYVLPNTNAALFAILFLDIEQCFHPITKKNFGNKNPSNRGSTRIICLTFSKYSRPLHKLV